ncbi:MAG: hypothetical protein HZC48_11500 [Nitrospirae bacterium]|nr:hypothetical protein [Nitrospirota bacterium]
MNLQAEARQTKAMKRKPALNKQNNQRLQPHGLKLLLSLADAVVLQSIEDLFSPFFRGSSLKFFNGKGFELCAGTTGMNENEKAGILTVLKQSGFKINSRKATPLVQEF